MKEFLTNFLKGKTTYAAALGLVVTGGAGWYVGLLSTLEAVTFILNGLGFAGARRAIGNSNNALMSLLVQTALDAQKPKAPPTP